MPINEVSKERRAKTESKRRPSDFQLKALPLGKNEFTISSNDDESFVYADERGRGGGEGGERGGWEGGRERETDRDRQRQTDRDRQIQTDRDRHRETDRKTDRQTANKQREEKGHPKSTCCSHYRPKHILLSPFLTGRMFVRRTYFGQFDEL